MLSHIQRESQSGNYTTARARARLYGVPTGLRTVAAALGQARGDGERRLRLRTLILIRWIAIVGQAFTIALVHFSLEFRLPLWPLFGAVALSALINLGLSFGFAATTRLTERSAALLLGYDILQLAFLLALTGGLQNPFSILLIVPVTLSATTLSLRTTVVLSSIVIAVATWLALFPSDLPWYEGTFRLPALYVGGLWLALVLGTALIAGYAWRIAHEARRLSDALAATQMALAREQQLSALGGLAAAAAHDLGSPLATIAVTARELANSVPKDSPLAEDVAELVSQTRRCREILKSLGQRPESEALRPFTRVPLSALLMTIADSYGRPEIDLAVAIERIVAGAPEPQLTPTPELKHGFANLIDNAIKFARHRVRIVVRLDAEEVAVRIEDDGPGFSPEVLELLGEPYISTPQRNDGLGLGVFIAQTLLARTGATLHFDNSRDGARVSVRWRRAALEELAPEK
ncbi:MAG TPA: ActS/PrrB/RegB family redox-sensitive histidine kinase [Geminicoccaceae bacterium]